MLLLYLKMGNFLDMPAPYFSEYIIHHKMTYYQKLRTLTEAGDWEGWILNILDMIEETATRGLE